MTYKTLCIFSDFFQLNILIIYNIHIFVFRIDVAGYVFRITLTKLNRHPETLLGNHQALTTKGLTGRLRLR